MAKNDKPDRSKFYPDAKPPAPNIPIGGASMSQMLASRGAGAAPPPVRPSLPGAAQAPWLSGLFGGAPLPTAPMPRPVGSRGRTPKRG